MARQLSKQEMEALDKVVMRFNLNKKWEDRGIEKGIEKGEILSLLRILNKKFVRLPDEIAKKIEQIDDKHIINSISPLHYCFYQSTLDIIFQQILLQFLYTFIQKGFAFTLKQILFEQSFIQLRVYEKNSSVFCKRILLFTKVILIYNPIS